MCGRFEIHSAIDIIAKMFQVDEIAVDLGPNYNIAPSQNVAVVMNDGRKNRLAACHWGFVPSWSRELKTGYRMINARAETVALSRTFRDAFLATRCLVPADGFFHWKKEATRKIPWYIRLRSGLPMGMAGLYNYWRSPGGKRFAPARSSRPTRTTRSLPSIPACPRSSPKQSIVSGSIPPRAIRRRSLRSSSHALPERWNTTP